MIIDSAQKFDRLSKELFGITSFNTLSNINGKLRLNLSDEEQNEEERGRIAYKKAISILNRIFQNKSIWLRVILWDDYTLEQLGIQNKEFLKFTDYSDENKVLYFYIPLYNEIIIKMIVRSIINYEIGLQPSLNISCLYFNFDNSIVANVYDDRGMDIVGTSISM